MLIEFIYFVAVVFHLFKFAFINRFFLKKELNLTKHIVLYDSFFFSYFLLLHLQLQQRL